MRIAKQRVRTREQFLGSLQQSFNNNRETYTHILVGAGFSRSAGIPLASEIAGILARYKNLRRTDPATPLSYSTIIRDFFEEGFSPDAEMEMLKKDPDYAELDYVAAYKSLFADAEIFPDNSVSRANFIADMISASQERYHGYNFESIYLAYLCNQARVLGRPRINTILTTNFDDVIPNSFSELSAPCRLLDQWHLIEKEDSITEYPRVVYLHGRYLHYDLANTEEEIKQRGSLIANFLRALPQASKLIVIGYSGWEDEVMTGIKAILADREHRRLAAGIHWCHYGKLETASTKLVELAESFNGLTITPDISALDALRLLLKASSCSENSVLQHIRNSSDRKRRDFERRLIRINEKDLGHETRPGLLSPALEEVEPPSAEQAIREGREAMHHLSSLTIAFSMIDSALRNRADLKPQEEAGLYRTRAALRQRYRINMEGALTDYQSALKLDSTEEVAIALGMADVYAALGKYGGANHFLGVARKLIKTGDRLNTALSDMLEGSIEFQLNNIAHAEALLRRAATVLTELNNVDGKHPRHGEPDVRPDLQRRGGQGHGPDRRDEKAAWQEYQGAVLGRRPLPGGRRDPPAARQRQEREDGAAASPGRRREGAQLPAPGRHLLQSGGQLLPQRPVEGRPGRHARRHSILRPRGNRPSPAPGRGLAGALSGGHPGRFRRSLARKRSQGPESL